MLRAATRALPTSCCGSVATIPPPTASRPGSPLAAGDFLDIAEAFAAHPGSPRAGQLVAGIERIFCTGGAQHSALIGGARDTLVELKGRASASGSPPTTSPAASRPRWRSTTSCDLFDFAVGCDSGFGSKPDPRMAHGFCKA